MCYNVSSPQTVSRKEGIMKEYCKINVFVKELPIRIRSRERNFRIKTTIILCLSLSLFVVFLGKFINDKVKLLNSDEYYYFPRNNDSPCSYDLSCNFSSSTSDHKEIWHSMSDEELMWRASSVRHMNEYHHYNCTRTPKVAFMFLTRGKLPSAPLWEMFFKGHQGFYSIYLHTSSEFTDESRETSVFYKRRIPSEPVEWGRSTMIDAERRLLANALLDFSNERFVLLSETCIPLFNFSTIYNYLINSNLSFVGSFDDPRRVGRGRYNKEMSPTISLSEWRKGSQWFEVDRKVAVDIVSDTKYYPVFRNHCHPPCYMDEQYVATLVTKLRPNLNSNKTITWVDWSQGGSHPARFVRKDVTEDFLNRIRFGFNCTYNGDMITICFLFARKFHPNTLGPLQELGSSLLGFDC